MSKNIKQIYAALELCENEIKILVGEYFNTRFNIIRVDRFPTSSISDFRIVNKTELAKEIQDAIKASSAKIGSDIEQVILVLPPFNFKRFPLSSKVLTNNGIIVKSDIARALTNSLKAKVDADVMVVNPVIVKYIANGISTRRLPENEVCEELTVNIDLLCADLEMCYEYVSVVEGSGLKILDITLSNYAVAKEAALLDESLSKPLIILDIGRSCTFLSLLSKGKLVSTEIVNDGLNSLINRIYRTYNIPYKDIARLVKYCIDYDSKHLDDIVYAWNDQGATRTIATRMLNEAIEKPLDALAGRLIAMCKPIIDAGASIILSGEGEQMKALKKILEEKAGTEIRAYYPDTIGVRDSTLTALYGSFFVYRDKVVLNDLNVSCIDLLKYDSLIEEKELDSEGETITTKIKNLFKQYMDRG